MELKIRFYSAEELKAIVETFTRNGYCIRFLKREGDAQYLIVRIAEVR